ncbi:MFS transporter [Nitriliruptor alkaliphilus]|uniref:MFS transporter n=1 Tax=Nitriliruptor alkaliphilus TaxID=427918 RepID=UPI0006965C42|nr:MFS transporter [Nitriliruptor alkaliphilus]
MTATTMVPPEVTERGATDGPRAWAFVVAATLAAAVGLGTVTSHGVLVAALAPITLVGVGAGALLVAVSALCQFGLGPFVGRLSDRSGVRRVVLLGAATYAAGSLAAARSADLRTGVLAYAVGTGIAGACTLAPLLAAAAGWHRRRRAAAVALVSAGNGIGALLIAPWLAASVEARGLAATWTSVGVVGTGLLLLAAVALQTPPTDVPGAVGPRLRTLTGDPALVRFYLAGVLGSAGVIGVLSYLVPYARELGHDPAHAGFLLGLTGAVGVASRLFVSTIPVVRAFGAYRASQVALAVSAGGWLLAPDRHAWLLVYVAVFGLASGLWSALAPLVVAEARPQHLASVLGVLYTSPAIGGATGPVVVGWLSRAGTLRHAAWFLAGALTLSAVILRPLPSVGRTADVRDRGGAR